MSAKWKKGLRSATIARDEQGQCSQCGTCCSFISIPPFREDELDRLPAEIQQVVQWYTKNNRSRPQAPTPCYFFDMTKRTCLIHEHKPQMCREFEAGGPACRKQRSDLLAALNAYRSAVGQWKKHYTRFVLPGGRIQEMAEFSLEDGVPEQADERWTPTRN